MPRLAFDGLPSSASPGAAGIEEDSASADRLSPLQQQNASDSARFEQGFGGFSGAGAGSLEQAAMRPNRQRAVVNRMRADDLAARGIPAYRNASGDVAPVTDETGGALTGLNTKTGIAYDSQGQPKQVSYGEEGPPIVSNPFDRIPARTDPKTGAIEKNGPGGIYQYLGQDPDVTKKVAQAATDKDLGKESALLGRKLTLDEHDLVQSDKAQKQLHSDLTGSVPALLDPKFKGADSDTVHKAIDSQFDSEYAAPAANETSGFFSKTLTPAAEALRADIDARKAKAHDTADQIFDLNDQMSGLHDSITQGREKQRAGVETLLAHQEGRTGPLDQSQADQTAGVGGKTGPAPGLYPPEENWSRILGGDDAVKEIQDRVKGGQFPTPMAPATVAALHDANDAQQKAEDLKESDPTAADKYKNFAANILNGLTQGVGELMRNPFFNKGEMAGGNLNPMNWGPHLVEAGERAAFGKSFGDLTKEWLGEKIPQETQGLVDNRLKDTIGAKAGNFIGGILPYVGAAIATKGTSVATPLLTSMFYASGYQRTLEDAQARGADPVKAELAANTVGVVNAVLALPLKTVGAAAEAIFGDTAPKVVQRAISNAYEHGGPEAVGGLLGKLSEAIKAGGAGSEKLRQEAVEGIQQVMAEIQKPAAQRVVDVAKTAAGHAILGAGVQTAENLAKKTYNPDQGTFEGVGEQALGFGALGALSEGFKQVADARKAKQALDIINSKKPPGGQAPAVGGGGPEKPTPSGGAPKQLEGGEVSEVRNRRVDVQKQPEGGKPVSAGVSAAESPDKGGAAPLAQRPGAEPAKTGGAGEAPELNTIAQAETAYLKQGGHADKLDAQEKLKGLREKFPDKADRLEAIREHFAPAVPAEDVTPPPAREGAATAGKPTGALTTETPAKADEVVKKSVDEAAHQAATSTKNALPEPSQAQKEAGNYQKGHVTVGGLDISIENPAGSKRQPEFKPLQSHYGYIRGTVGADKDHVDIFVKQGTPKDWSGPVFVVNQHEPVAPGKPLGKFDEHKAVIGVANQSEALSEYRANYQPGWRGAASVVKFDNPAQFKQWAESGAKGQPVTTAAVKKLAEPTQKGEDVQRERPEQKGAGVEKAISGQPAEGRLEQRPSESSAVRGEVQERGPKAGLSVSPEETRASVEKSKSVHADEIASLGVSHVEEPVGRAGIAIKNDGSAIMVDHKALAEAASFVHDRGGDSAKWIQDAHKEELIHYRHILAAGKVPALIRSQVWSSLTPETKKELASVYPDSRKPEHLAAEYIRMVAQHRETGRITEAHFRNTGAITKILEGRQSPELEAHLESMQKITDQEEPPKKPVTPQVPAAPGTKYVLPSFVTEPYAGKNKAVAARAERRIDLAKRLQELIKAERIPATEQTVVYTLLTPPGKKEPSEAALAQAENKVAKYESARNFPEFLADYWAKTKSGPLPTAFTPERLKLAGLTQDQVVTAIEKAIARGVPEDFILDRSKYTATKLAYEDIVNEGAPNATDSGKQQSGKGGELSRVPPRENVRPDTPEVRKSEGAKADAGGGIVQRGETPATEQEPESGQPQKSTELDDKANKALDDAFEGLFAGQPLRPGSEWVWPEPQTDEDFANIVQPHGKGVEAGLRLSPESAADVQSEHDEAAKEMLEAATSGSARFQALMGKQTYLAGKLEGVKRAGPNYEEYLRRNESLGAGIPQQSIPVDKLPKLIVAAQELIRSGIDTPEKMASVLEEKFGGKARPFSQAFWDAVGIVRPDLRGTHNWTTIYGAPSKQEEEDRPADTLRDQVARKLLSKTALPRTALTELAKGVAPGLNPKEIDEAAEAGVVDAARTIARSAAGQISPVDTFDKMVQLYENQPNLTAKTSTSKVNQAYSTPAPLAYAASRLADISGGTSIYEPSAGNGILLMEADPKTQTIFANEINGARVKALADQGYKPTAQDATSYRPPLGVDRMVSNAPFGTVLDANGHNKVWPMWDSATNQIDFAIAAKSLEALTDDGRAVLIVGGKNIKDPDERAKAYASENQANFWKRLYRQYKVVDHFTVDGDLYSKQGAGWPVDVIVVAGRGKSPIQLPSADAPRIIGSWDGLREEITRTDAERIEAGRYDAARDREKLGGIVSELRDITGAEQRVGPKGNAKPAIAGDVSRGGEQSPARSDRESQPVAGVERGIESGNRESGSERPGAVGPGAGERESEQRGQQLGGFRVPYKPASKAKSFGIFVPTNMEVPAREALERLQARVGAVDKYLRSKVAFKEGSLSAEQIDAAALAIDAIENKTAFVNGDQGGVGKGRVAAVMLAYALDHGHIPIFATKDEKLYAAMIEDFHDIGREDLDPMMTNADVTFKDYAGKIWSQGNSTAMRKAMEEIARSGKLPTGKNVLFTSYAQIQSDEPKGWKPGKGERAALKAGHTPPPDGARMLALKRLAPKSIIVADESHLASGDSIRAWRLAPLLASAHGVYYSSATFAKRPDSMGIYSRTSLSHATQSMGDLVDAMKQGGVPLQQVVSSILASDGLYLRRERDFSHAVFRTHINLDTKERDIKLADNFTEGLRAILGISNKMKQASVRLNKILRREGKQMHVENAPRVETTNFSSKLHNLVSQYLFSIKSESAVRRAVEGVTKGFTDRTGETVPHKVIITVQNTMEKPIEALERSHRPLTFNGMLLQYLDSQRTLTSGRGASAQSITITDTPDEEFELLTDRQLEQQLIVPNPEEPEKAGVNEKALAELFRRMMAGVFKEAQATIEGLDLANMPISPIDHIKQQLARAGIKTGEITGRKVGIDEDGVIYRTTAPTKAAHLRTLDEFNNGDMPAMVMNASGSTGISAHASEKFKNQDPRAMLILQPHLDINEFMQSLWRTDRTGQVHDPYYELLQTALSAELRPAAILGRKMASLNANTTSNAENEVSTGNKGVDIFNQYGDQVVYSYLRSDPAFVDMLDMPKIMSGEVLGAMEDVLGLYENDGQFAAAVSGRVAVLPEEEAAVFWEKVQADYVGLINYLTELGENELLTDTMDIKAETLESKELTPAVTGQGRASGFDQPSKLEKIKADIGSKPLAASEVVSQMEKIGTEAYEIGKTWETRANAWREKELQRLSEKVVGWNEEKAAAHEKRWRDQEEEIRQALSLIGNGLHLKSQKGLEGYGAITSVQFDEDHLLTPSKQIFTIAINTTKKTLKVPASQLPSIARLAIGDFEKLYESTAERSNTRYMITGNLLSAYLAIRDAAPTAKIVQYTNDKDELRQGILMPSKFTPGALAKKRIVENATHMRQLLDAGRALASGDGAVTVVKPRTDYMMRVPASKTMGGAYWRDSELAGLMEGGEFHERGGGMVGKIPSENLGKVYQRLLDLSATLFFTEQGEGEALGAGKPHKAPAAFYHDDMTEAARNIGLSVKEAFTMLRHLVTPASDVNNEARDRAMKMLGERNQKAYETDRVLEAARQAVDKMPRPEQIAFVDRMKRGEKQPTSELQDLDSAMRKIDTDSWDGAHDAYVALGFKSTEIPLAWKENHYRVLWKVIPGETPAAKAAWIGKSRRPLRGSMGQHKQSTLDDMSEGIAEGGVPYSYNFVEMFKLAQADLWKLTTTLKAWKWAKDNGFVQFVRGPFGKAPDGMVPLNDAIARVYFPAESGEGLIAAGQYFVEEGFGRLLNNYLSFDHIRATQLGRSLIWIKNATTALELSLSPFHAVFETLDAVGSNIGLGLQKLVNRGILGGNAKVAFDGLMDMAKAVGTPITHGLGADSLGQQIRRAAADPNTFFASAEGKKMLKSYPRAREMIDDLFSGGWKPTELEQDWRTNSIRTFVDAVSDIKAGSSDNYIGAGLRAFPAANEWLMRPLFDYYIPNLKVAQFFKEYAEAIEQNERKLKGGVLTRAALARQTWRFVEDRFGEMNYDTLFWNRTFKSAMQLMFRSVTWKLGSVSAFGGAFTGQAREFRDAFKEGRAPQLHRNTAWLFGMMLLTAALGTVLMKTLSGKWPSSLTDYVFPQIDPKDDKIRGSLPTYFKDLVHLIHSPVTYVTSSMAGWIGRVADLLRNKDYYGVQIRDSDDSIVKQALQVGSYVGQTVLPFSIRGYKNLSQQDVGGLRKAIALMGVQPAPRFIGQTAAERAAGDYWQGQKSEAGISPAQYESKVDKRRIVAQIEHGDRPNISQALARGSIKAKDIKPLFQRAQMGTLASQVLHMPLVDAEKIYERANPEEKAKLAPIISRKRASAARVGKRAFSGF